ncbi:hypothetical protein ACRAWC_12055 [Leifsonia sp. L25]|uniref:hypothetical protein n=1 Tax=Leifsonia sp. L25 TaxID=3423957 RepID=UPI003D68F30E
MLLGDRIVRSIGEGEKDLDRLGVSVDQDALLRLDRDGEVDTGERRLDRDVAARVCAHGSGGVDSRGGRCGDELERVVCRAVGENGSRAGAGDHESKAETCSDDQLGRCDSHGVAPSYANHGVVKCHSMKPYIEAIVAEVKCKVQNFIERLTTGGGIAADLRTG